MAADSVPAPDADFHRNGNRAVRLTKLTLRQSSKRGTNPLCLICLCDTET